MRLFALVGCLLAAAIGQPATSAVVSFDFMARIDAPDAPFAVGTPITGSFSFDNALAPSSFSPGGAFYDAHPSFLLTINTPVQTLSGSGFAGVGNDIPDIGEVFDSFFLYASMPQHFLSFDFYDPTAQAFGGTSLPASFPFLYQGVIADPNDDDDLTVPSAYVSYYNTTSGAEVRASVLSITRSGASPAGAVPEPSSWAMMIVGFGLVGGGIRAGRGSRRVAAYA